MKILITGGAGFIGSHVADAYINAGHEVVIVDNLSTGKRENISPKAKFYEMDILSPDLKVLIQKERPDVINHHAAHIDVRRSVTDPEHDLKINVLGIIHLMGSCAGLKLKKVIFASSGGAIYGEQNSYPARESHTLDPLSPYGINKLAGEKYLSYYSRLMGFGLTCLRYANIYGPRQNALGEAGVIAIFAHQLLSGQTPVINGQGNQTRDYVYVGDVVKANVLALGSNADGVFNVGTGIETNVNRIYSDIASLLKMAGPAKIGPSKDGEQMRSSLSSEALKKECGYAPDTPLSEGLRITMDWFVASKDHS